MDQTVIVGAVAGALWVADRMGWLPSKKSSADAAGELSIAEKTIKRLRGERDRERIRAEKLAQERTNEPVLEVLGEISRQLAQNAQSQSQVIDRLATHNGSFAHMEQSLDQLREGMRLLTGFIASIADIPVREKP